MFIQDGIMIKKSSYELLFISVFAFFFILNFINLIEFNLGIIIAIIIVALIESLIPYLIIILIIHIVN
jgi:hypothetical protein